MYLETGSSPYSQGIPLKYTDPFHVGYPYRTKQHSMEHTIHGISKRDKKTIQWIRNQTQVVDIIQSIKGKKWRWTGHLTRTSDNSWTKRVPEWRPWLGSRQRGKEKLRWNDELAKFIGNKWIASPQDGHLLAPTWGGLRPVVGCCCCWFRIEACYIHGTCSTSTDQSLVHKHSQEVSSIFKIWKQIPNNTLGFMHQSTCCIVRSIGLKIGNRPWWDDLGWNFMQSSALHSFF